MCNCRNVTVLKGDKGDQGIQGPVGPEGTMGYKAYVASFSQSGTSDPAAIIRENTLTATNPSWARGVAGEYILTAANSFPSYESKLWISGTCLEIADGASVISLTNKSLSLVGYYTITVVNIDTLKMTVFNTGGTKVDLSTLIGSTTKIYLPEIRVYP
jgi:hypothetical protein